MQIHLFTDILWVQFLLSAMILVPEYFGTSSVMLSAAFLSTNSAPSHGTSLKSHYHFHSKNKGVPFLHGVLNSRYYAVVVLGVRDLSSQYLPRTFWSFENLKVIEVFLVNLTPLLACQSYRFLLSIPTTEFPTDKMLLRWTIGRFCGTLTEINASPTQLKTAAPCTTALAHQPNEFQNHSSTLHQQTWIPKRAIGTRWSRAVLVHCAFFLVWFFCKFNQEVQHQTSRRTWNAWRVLF